MAQPAKNRAPSPAAAPLGQAVEVPARLPEPTCGGRCCRLPEPCRPHPCRAPGRRGTHNQIEPVQGASGRQSRAPMAKRPGRQAGRQAASGQAGCGGRQAVGAGRELPTPEQHQLLAAQLGLHRLLAHLVAQRCSRVAGQQGIGRRTAQCSSMGGQEGDVQRERMGQAAGLLPSTHISSAWRPSYDPPTHPGAHLQRTTCS